MVLISGWLATHQQGDRPIWEPAPVAFAPGVHDRTCGRSLSQQGTRRPTTRPSDVCIRNPVDAPTPTINRGQRTNYPKRVSERRPAARGEANPTTRNALNSKAMETWEAIVFIPEASKALIPARVLWVPCLSRKTVQADGRRITTLLPPEVWPCIGIILRKERRLALKQKF